VKKSKKLVFAGIMVLIVVFFIEGLARLTYFAMYRRGYDVSDLYDFIKHTNYSFSDEFALWWDEEIIHPYLGFVIDFKNKNKNNETYGFTTSMDPVVKREPGKLNVLVLGGSQGAHRVNGLMVEALASNLSGEQIMVRHQTGSSDEAWVRKAYAEAGVTAQVSSFIGDMAAAYREADLVVSRAGATTLAELAVLGKPAILIPYPYAADDHQTTNAAFLVRGGAALMFQEHELDGAKLRDEIMGLLHDAPRLQTMAARMKQYARPEATGTIVDKSMELLAAVAATG